MAGKRPGEDPLGQGWGRGEQNAFGLYEYYDYPEETDGLSWQELWELEDLIEGCFHLCLGVDLGAVMHTHTARWFRVRMVTLISDDNPLGRAVTARIKANREDAEEEVDDG